MTTETGGAAFPAHQDDVPGMTLRDWFAGMAMQAILSNDGAIEAIDEFETKQKWPTGKGMAIAAYSLADDMLAARGGPHVVEAGK